MKDWTEKEITTDLQRIDAEIKGGKVNFHTLGETKKHFDTRMRDLKKQRQQREKNEAKKSTKRRIAPAV
jgi:hypothetical protein